MPLFSGYLASYAFRNCSTLTEIDLPNCTAVDNNAFYQCKNLSYANLINCQMIGANAFYMCSKLTTLSFPNCTIIYASAFANCSNLFSLYLTGSVYVSLYSSVFNYTPFTVSSNGVYGSIYVPASMLETYKTLPNWSNLSQRLVGI